MIEPIFNLQKISADQENMEIIEYLNKYPKFRSVYIMASAGLPVSKSLIIVKDTPKSRKMLEDEIRNWSVNEVTVRSDIKGGSVYAKSVQNCKLENIWVSILNFLNKDLAVMVIAQGDVFHNTYSANILFDPCKNDKKYYMEIAGPGFCATDINKRDIINERGNLTSGYTLEDRKVVSQKVYDEQVDLMKKSVIDKEIEKGKVFKNDNEAKIWLDKYLKSIDALILKNKTYKPISKSHLQTLWGFVPKIKTACNLMDPDKKTIYVISMSFVFETGKEIPYFWDIHPYFGYKHN